VLAADRHRAETLLEYFSARGVKAAPDFELSKLPEPGSCVVSVGALSAAWKYQARGSRCSRTRSHRRKQGIPQAAEAEKSRLGPGAAGQLRRPGPGDLVVHEYHGIGRFAGIFRCCGRRGKGLYKNILRGLGQPLCPRHPARPGVEIHRRREGAPVRLSRMGGGDRHRAKSGQKARQRNWQRAHRAIRAEAAQRGHAFASTRRGRRSSRSSFGYVETDDQLRCAREIKEDMEKSVPMDRLLCGDVGYGKTEVALRAVMKCVLTGNSRHTGPHDRARPAALPDGASALFRLSG
jgi:transcription-repair coupling factor (superfamily II helicase)